MLQVSFPINEQIKTPSFTQSNLSVQQKQCVHTIGCAFISWFRTTKYYVKQWATRLIDFTLEEGRTNI